MTVLVLCLCYGESVIAMSGQGNGISGGNGCHMPGKTTRRNVGVVILNYNGWQDTIVCAESVLASTVPPAWVVVVDNGSTNDSPRWLRHWAAGRMDFVLPELGVPAPCPKPVPLLELDEEQARSVAPAPLVLLRRAGNTGYAAGNNAGIRLLMRWGADAVWILNNDTVVDKNALEAMTRRLFAKPRPGLCGSLICYQDNASLVQCRAGGRTNKWTGLSVLDGNRQDFTTAARLDPAQVENRINFIYGASVMASRAFIERVGLLDERYFLYCEEQDWACRAGGRFDLAYAPDALVWHKEGASTGFSHAAFNPRRLFLLAKSRLLLTARHTPAALPSVCLGIVYAAARMAWRRLGHKPATATAAISAIRQG